MQTTSGLPFVPWLARAFAYSVWLLVALPVVGAMSPGWERVVSAVLLAGSGVLLGFFLTRQRAPATVRGYLAVQTILVLSVYAIRPDAALGVAQMFFLFAAQAVLFLPGRDAILWVALFSVVTFVGGLYVIGRDGLLAVLATTGGNAIFGGLAAVLRQTRLARQRVESLLQDVQESHERLRELSVTAQQLAVAHERERIAREMHDALGHRLTVAVVQLEGARRLIPREPERAAAMVEQMREHLKEGLGELRATVAELRSPVEGTLEAALEQLVDAFRRATGLEVHLHLTASLPGLTDDVRHALYRTCQEGLTNVQRHADAHRVWVILEHVGDGLALRIDDDGRGFPDEVAQDRFGLGGIAERIGTLQGAMALGSRPGGGARLEVRVPVPASVAAAAEASVDAQVGPEAPRA